MARKPITEEYLDDLVHKLSRSHDAKEREALWEEIVRRFSCDVAAACQYALNHGRAGSLKELHDQIFREAIPPIEKAQPEHFTCNLAEKIEYVLTREALEKVQDSLYLRQFVHNLNRNLIGPAMDLMNYRYDFARIAEVRGKDVTEVEDECKRVFEDFRRLFGLLDRKEIRERTNHVWDRQKMGETDVRD